MTLCLSLTMHQSWTNLNHQQYYVNSDIFVMILVTVLLLPDVAMRRLNSAFLPSQGLHQLMFGPHFLTSDSVTTTFV